MCYFKVQVIFLFVFLIQQLFLNKDKSESDRRPLKIINKLTFEGD